MHVEEKKRWGGRVCISVWLSVAQTHKQTHRARPQKKGRVWASFMYVKCKKERGDMDILHHPLLPCCCCGVLLACCLLLSFSSLWLRRKRQGRETENKLCHQLALQSMVHATPLGAACTRVCACVCKCPQPSECEDELSPLFIALLLLLQKEEPQKFFLAFFTPSHHKLLPTPPYIHTYRHT